MQKLKILDEATSSLREYTYTYSRSEIVDGEERRTVFRGTGEAPDLRPCAIKLIQTGQYLSKPEALKLFKNEEKILTRLRLRPHPYIIGFLDAQVAAPDSGTTPENTVAFIVLEYAYHGDLHAIIEKKGPLSERVTRRFVVQIAEAMRHLKREGYAHNDVKPANIGVAHNFDLKLLDFGLSQEAGKMSDDYLLGTEGF